VGVVVVVGGPQTRAGSHRQFVLLARALAVSGTPALRFDLTGMGDSPGPRPDFEKAGPDIARACDALLAEVPGVRQVVLWGLCDGATAALLYAPGDPRVIGVVALNPWARTEAAESGAIVRGWYLRRLVSAAFWRRLLTGGVPLRGVTEAIGHVRRARGSRRGTASATVSGTDLPTRIAAAIERLAAPVLVQLSGRDLTAAAYELAMRERPLTRIDVRVERFPEADHTVSDPEHWARVVASAVAFAGEASRRSR
jgi:exosortase A-associated hydrolase 1